MRILGFSRFLVSSLTFRYSVDLWLPSYWEWARSGLYILVYRQFFRGIPKEIEEAAILMMWSPTTFVRVMAPNATCVCNRLSISGLALERLLLVCSLNNNMPLAVASTRLRSD